MIRPSLALYEDETKKLASRRTEEGTTLPLDDFIFVDMRREERSGWNQEEKEKKKEKDVRE
jgi:hypothetical protein